MDVSKLPKLSDSRAAAGAAAPVVAQGTDGDLTATTAAAEATPAAPVPVEATVRYREPTTVTVRPPALGADVWISTVLGLLFVFLGMTFAKFVVAKLTHHAFDTGYVWPDDDTSGRAGQPVAYFDLQGYSAWTDMGVFLFGLTLLFEAASKAAVVLRPSTASRGLLGLAILLTLATVALNVVAAGLLLHYGVTPILSGLAVAFGGWILFDEWSTLQASRAAARQAAGPQR